jgi:penicillin-insensitive murein endopeptidase
LPFEHFDLASIYQVLQRNPEFLGPASVGSITNGSLINGVQWSSSGLWLVQAQNRAWGTPALIACLEQSIAAVHESFPASHRLFIGELSNRDGGYLPGHLSHQSGLDADVGYFYHGEHGWYLPATEKNFDVERTWALIRSMLADCALEYVFVDRLVLVLLREHATKIEENQAWVASVFALGPTKPGIVRFAHGHSTHMHVRIHDAVAQALGRRVMQAKEWAKQHPSLVRQADARPSPNSIGKAGVGR